MLTGMILLDLHKSFDTLDNGILLEKMKYFGFQTYVIKCFESYLSNRKYLLCIDNVFCKARTLTYDFPQNYIVGPLPFLLNVNDIPQSLTEAGSYLYVDENK